MSKSTSEIVYDQAVRAVEQQVRQLDELRNRTAVILAAAGVVTGFLGRAFVVPGLGAFAYCAIAAFVVSALACVWVLLPRWDSWEFSINAKKLAPYFLDDDDPEPPEALFRYLADPIRTTSSRIRRSSRSCMEASTSPASRWPSRLCCGFLRSV